MEIGKEKPKMPRLTSINTSKEKGKIKTPVQQARIVEGYGIEGDVHAGAPVKQVSLLDKSEIEEMEERTGVNLNPGDFAENLTSQGLDIDSVPVGTKISVGDEVRLEVSQIGKTCHDDCVVKDKTGECIMPKKGLFFRVIKGGTISPGDEIELLEEED